MRSIGSRRRALHLLGEVLCHDRQFFRCELGDAVAHVLGTLAEKKINVTAIDAVSAGAGRYGAILWVAAKDMNKAAKALGAV